MRSHLLQVLVDAAGQQLHLLGEPGQPQMHAIVPSTNSASAASGLQGRPSSSIGLEIDVSRLQRPLRPLAGSSQVRSDRLQPLHS